ncbi:uncharacterized protein LOC127700961 isoform X2 [Mytilus californianus]|uniref:uncharacterized protein LOC127700961 isoform X2 n=1 Tax=Mytilus californianus TaxID=6549 RepID=UPI002247093D|nr:uncharacterized protein LOC127700961 isoform X2 [Mytilus californianus]
MYKTKDQTEAKFHGYLKTNKLMEMEYDGNFFIMDSEQLVSNPFQTMKEEAMDNAKKVSLTEKLTSVKNNVCENHLSIKNTKLQRDISYKLKQIHDNASQLRYEAKVYDINKRKTDLENAKRYEPYKDFGYDEMQLKNQTKRLGVVSQSHYLDRKQQFPLRGRTVNDLHPNAVVRAARQIYHRRQVQSRQEDRSRRGDISTPGTSVSSAKSRKSLLWQRRDSRSAPPMKSSVSLNFEDNSTKLPSLSDKSKVKFALNIKTPEPIQRAKTFHPGMQRRQSVWQDSDDEYEDDDEEEYIDIDKLRSVVFGNKYANSVKNGYDTPRTVASFQSSNTSKRPTEEDLKKEQQQLQRKIDDFFGNLNTNGSDIESDDELEIPLPEIKTAPQMSKASMLMSIFAKSVSSNTRKETDKDRLAVSEPEPKSKEPERSKSSLSQRSKSPYTVKTEPKKPQDLWKYIKTSVQRGEIQRCQTPSKLIIEQMTHLDLTNSEKKHIPLKSANRALRHTPTFKMRQLVQRMQRERTKYEQFEIDQKKTKMQDEQMDGVEIMA